MSMLRVWQHVRLRQESVNVSGALLQLDADGVVLNEGDLTPEAVKSMVTHPNWRQVERDAAAVLKKRIGRLRAKVEGSARLLQERESLYRQAGEAYDAAVREYQDAEAILAKTGEGQPAAEPAPPAPAESPPPRPPAPSAPKAKRAIPEALRHFFEDPTKITNEEELRALATSYGIATTRKGRAKIEAEMKALVGEPTEEGKSS